MLTSIALPLKIRFPQTSFRWYGSWDYPRYSVNSLRKLSHVLEHAVGLGLPSMRPVLSNRKSKVNSSGIVYSNFACAPLVPCPCPLAVLTLYSNV